MLKSLRSRYDRKAIMVLLLIKTDTLIKSQIIHPQLQNAMYNVVQMLYITQLMKQDCSVKVKCHILHGLLIFASLNVPFCFHLKLMYL